VKSSPWGSVGPTPKIERRLNVKKHYGRKVLKSDACRNYWSQLIQEFSLLLQAALPSDGGYAAASEGGRGLAAPLPHGPLRDPLGPVLATFIW
jgi:hypothetical protein